MPDETFTETVVTTVTDPNPKLWGFTVVAEADGSARVTAQFRRLHSDGTGFTGEAVRYDWADQPATDAAAADPLGTLVRTALFSAVLQDNEAVRALEAQCGQALVGLPLALAGFLIRPLAAKS